MNEIMTAEQRGAVAFKRFRELMDDLSHGEDHAIDLVYELLGHQTGLGKKAIKQWYSRESIPPYAIFNLAAALGVDVNWLGGLTEVSKEKAILKGGLYARDIERLARLRAQIESQRPKRFG